MPGEGPYPQRSGPDRREWWGIWSRARCSMTTHSSPLAGAYGARFAVMPPLYGCWLGTGITLPVPTHLYPTLVPTWAYQLVMHTDQPCQCHRARVHMTVSGTP